MTPRLSRRSFLAAGATLLGARGAAFGQVHDFDLVIVGAGAAGLAAAREARRLGRSYALIEARQRIGGRLYTDRGLGDPFDAGALYIHWAERNPWRDIAAELGAETRQDRGGGGPFRLYERGALTPDSERQRRRAAFATLSRRLDGDGEVADVSIADIVADDGPEVLGAAGGLSRMAMGEEPERVSARDYARLWSGDDLILPAGYGALAERYGEGLSARPGVAAKAIDWSGAGVRVTTEQGVISARAAIVTVPVGVLAAEAIAFTPALPDRTREAIGGLAMGALAKIAMKFDGARFGIPVGTDIFEVDGPRVTYDFDCWAFGRDIVVTYVGGDHARELVGRGPGEAIATALEEFARVVGPEAKAHFVAGRAHGWVDDPFARGAYSHALPGSANAREKLAEAVGDRIHFAGEATGGEAPDFGGAMTAGGAFLAGRAAARRALRS